MIRLLRSSTVWTLLSIPLLGLLADSAIAQGAIREGEYTSPNRKFSLNIPKSSNRAGVPYMITVLDNNGDNQYDKVMFHVGDFGEYLVVGARTLPPVSISAMDKDNHRTVLRNISQASLMGWRRDFAELPEVSEESFFDSVYGEAVLRVYRAKKGSLLTMAQGSRPTPADPFDTNIASIVARQGALVLFVLVQNDESPNNTEVVKTTANQTFRNTKILATSQALGPSTGPPSLPGKSVASPLLQRDILQFILGLDGGTDEHCKQRKIVNTEILIAPASANSFTAVERWTLDRCGKPIRYQVTVNPSPRGGTDFTVGPE